MNKKAVFSLALILLISAGAMAQGIRVGVRGGVNLSDLKYEPKDETGGTPNSNSLTSFNAGLIFDIPLIPELSIQPGVGLSGKGSKVDYDNALGNFTAKINPLYLEIPVNVLFKPQIAPGTRLYFGAGPYIGLGIGGKVSFSGDTPAGDFYSDHDLKFGNDSGDDLKSTDIGANVLAGFEFGPGLLLGVQYGMSFTNNAPDSDNSDTKILRNKVFSINAGFLF